MMLNDQQHHLFGVHFTSTSAKYQHEQKKRKYIQMDLNMRTQDHLIEGLDHAGSFFLCLLLLHRPFIWVICILYAITHVYCIRVYLTYIDKFRAPNIRPLYILIKRHCPRYCYIRCAEDDRPTQFWVGSESEMLYYALTDYFNNIMTIHIASHMHTPIRVAYKGIMRRTDTWARSKSSEDPSHVDQYVVYYAQCVHANDYIDIWNVLWVYYWDILSRRRTGRSINVWNFSNIEYSVLICLSLSPSFSHSP